MIYVLKKKNGGKNDLKNANYRKAPQIGMASGHKQKGSIR